MNVPSITIPNFRPKRLKNHTLWGGTYLYTSYRGVPPRKKSLVTSRLQNRPCLSLLHCASSGCACPACWTVPVHVGLCLSCYASVNSSSAHPGISIFFKKVGKFPWVGTHKLSKCPGVGTKNEGKCPAPGIVAFQHLCSFFINQ